MVFLGKIGVLMSISFRFQLTLSIKSDMVPAHFSSFLLTLTTFFLILIFVYHMHDNYLLYTFTGMKGHEEISPPLRSEL